MDTPRTPRGERGFTITEIMVAIAILGLLAAIAAPNMSIMIRTQRLKTAAFDVYSSLVFARSEAIKRNTQVTVTPLGGDWAKGWEIKQVADNRVLREQSGWDSVTATGPAEIRYGSSGRLTTTVDDIFLQAYGVEEGAKRCVKIDISGRPVTKEGAC